MITDIDIYRAATSLSSSTARTHLSTPPCEPDELMETGDMDGRAVWLRIVKAVEELLAKERPEGEKVH